MLVLSRKAGQSIHLGDHVRLSVEKVSGTTVKLGIEAPPEVQIRRGELVDRPQRHGASAQADAVSPGGSAPIHSAARILIVDDNPIDRDMYQQLLGTDRQRRYCFFESETAEEGLEACRTLQPDCLLLDFRLPDFNGVEFLDMLIEQSRLTMPVVMLTGCGSERVAVEAMKRGVYDYLIKQELTDQTLCRAVHEAMLIAHPTTPWN